MKNNLLNITTNFDEVKQFTVSNQSIVSDDKSVEAILLASTFMVHNNKLVVIKDSLYEANKLYERLCNYVDEEDLLFYPSEESLQLEAIATSKELVGERIATLDKLSRKNKYILVTNTSSIVRFLSPCDAFRNSCIDIELGKSIKISDFSSKLVDLGYSKVNKIEQSLQFAVRGGVVDVYSINNINPIRIEFFGDQIDSIREFSLDDQRTIKTVETASIIPATDLLFDLNKLDNLDIPEEDKLLIKEENSYSTIYKYYSLLSNPSCLLDYCEDAKIIYSYINKIKDNYDNLLREAKEFYPDNKLKIYHPLIELLRRDYLEIKQIKNNKNDLEFPVRSFFLGQLNIKQVITLLKEYLNTYKIVVSLDNSSQVNYFKQLCEENDLDLYPLTSVPVHNLSYTEEKINEGIELYNEKIIYLSCYDIFNYAPLDHKVKSSFKSSVKITDISSLEVGDYVVHEDYGIAKFKGIKTIEIDGMHKDYIDLEFARNRIVGIGASNYTSIRKYVSKDGYSPKLSTFGGNEWNKTKERIKQKLKDITAVLLNNYLSRSQEIGFACNKDNFEQEEFERSFPYELTVDQKKSVEEIKLDMESPRPMDRILCGDVGFGKTEVAFIAAYKAMLNNKQVCLLCPTTLLARQHYNVALQRFKDFPVNIEMLSRLVSESKANKIIQDANEGKLNLLIGTHKILNKSLKFKDLGLLIIDEEQRFGVQHKEAIKQLRQNVDVLTLSATPIPRTMQTALIGLKEMSQIKTPPKNRMSVQTYVLPYSSNVIKEAINKELARGGQVFYLVNNISILNDKALQLKYLIPNLKTGIIHGQMNKTEIEKTMIDFVNGELDLLLCTSIIENGIDIRNANTIIVEDADRFGLSQLYQIRGRVGRGDKLAYAYLFYGIEKTMSDSARKRLKAIKEFTELGSGYNVALRDLTIRGAGDVLGTEQAGFIDSVGIDMYIKLLQEVIDEAKNGPKEKIVKVNKSLNIDAYVPSEFAKVDENKLEIYKDIAETNSLENIEKLTTDLTDFYGKLPPEIVLLLEKRRLEIYMQNKLVDDLVETVDQYEIVLNEKYSKFENIGIEIFELCNKVSANIELGYGQNKIRIRIPKKDKNWLNTVNKLLNKLSGLLNKYDKNNDII